MSLLALGLYVISTLIIAATFFGFGARIGGGSDCVIFRAFGCHSGPRDCCFAAARSVAPKYVRDFFGGRGRYISALAAFMGLALLSGGAPKEVLRSSAAPPNSNMYFAPYNQRLSKGPRSGGVDEHHL